MTGMIESYQNLNVYKKAFDASISIHHESRNFPKDEIYGLTSQIRRSSKSICANIAEGFAKQKKSKMEFKRFLLMALGSCHETKVWIEYCHKLQYINDNCANHWEHEYESIRKMLNSLHSKS